MTEIRSLVVSRWRPHDPDGGAPLRNLQNILGLGALGPVDVVSIGRPEEKAAPDCVRDWTHFRADEIRATSGTWLFRRYGHPQVDAYMHPGAVAHLQAAFARNAYDVAVIEEIPLAGYLPIIRAAGVPAVFDDHNVEAPLRAASSKGAMAAASGRGPVQAWRRQRYRIQAARIAAIERRSARISSLVWACSDQDAAELVRLYGPCAPVRVVPNAVDVGALAEARAGRKPPEPGTPLDLVYLGSYGYYPNEEAALRLGREILPALRQAGIKARVTFVGRHPTPTMEALAAADADITVTGGVASIAPYLSGASIMVVPIAIGSGTRFKILEAFAAGCPVVSTAKGAEGIAGPDGVHLRLAETTQDFVAAIGALAADPSVGAALAGAAYDLVDREYSWAAAGRDIVESLDLLGLGRTSEAGR
jgi:glycosyltransferase involved in cell wall biosynthesis